jgi:ubiquinone/menaquinone biosynthesis C-methylase UbiE
MFMDFMQLNFPSQSFDAVNAFNCLLHVPNADLPDVLAAIRKVRKPAGFSMPDCTAVSPSKESCQTLRTIHRGFFSFRTDESDESFVEPYFEVLDFHVVKGQVRFSGVDTSCASID